LRTGLLKWILILRDRPAIGPRLYALGFNSNPDSSKSEDFGKIEKEG
jgi:hypothetical protein